MALPLLQIKITMCQLILRLKVLKNKKHMLNYIDFKLKMRIIKRSWEERFKNLSGIFWRLKNHSYNKDFN